MKSQTVAFVDQQSHFHQIRYTIEVNREFNKIHITDKEYTKAKSIRSKRNNKHSIMLATKCSRYQQAETWGKCDQIFRCPFREPTASVAPGFRSGSFPIHQTTALFPSKSTIRPSLCINTFTGTLSRVFAKSTVSLLEFVSVWYRTRLPSCCIVSQVQRLAEHNDRPASSMLCDGRSADESPGRLLDISHPTATSVLACWHVGISTGYSLLRHSYSAQSTMTWVRQAALRAKPQCRYWSALQHPDSMDSFNRICQSDSETAQRQAGGKMNLAPPLLDSNETVTNKN